MSLIKRLMEMIAEQEGGPKVGDLVQPYTDTGGVGAKYWRVKKVENGAVTMGGGPRTLVYDISKFYSPSTFKTDDPVWSSENGKTIWKVKR